MLKKLSDTWDDVFRGKGRSVNGGTRRQGGGAPGRTHNPVLPGSTPGPVSISIPPDIRDAIDTFLFSMQKEIREQEIERAFWGLTKWEE